LQANKPPFKTGSHTYAAWKSSSTNERRDGYFTGEEMEEDKDSADEDLTEKGRRQRRRRDWEKQFDDFDDERDENDLTEFSSLNPFVEWLRKIYDAIFFYGLEVPVPRSSKRRRRGESVNENKVQSKSKLKQSPFFTSSEQRSQQIIATTENFQDPDTPSNTGRKSNIKNDYNSSSTSSSSISSNSSSNKKQQKPFSSSTTVTEETLRRRVLLIDKVLQNLASNLELLDADILRLENLGFDDPNSSMQLEKMYAERDSLKAQIEDTQIDYVSLRAELE